MELSPGTARGWAAKRVGECRCGVVAVPVSYLRAVAALCWCFPAVHVPISPGSPMRNLTLLTLSFCVNPGLAQTWTQITTPGAPSPRAWHAMVYDPIRGSVLLFGGSTGGGETWEYGAAGWVLRTPVTSPPARERHAMVFDSGRNVVVLFGGDTPTRSNDTWEWDGTNWTQRLPTTRPPARVHASMAYDAARARTVLHGGDGLSGTDLLDTWEWDGSQWTQVVTTSPGTSVGLPMVFDTGRGRCQMAVRANTFMDMWEFDGSAWTLVPASNIDHGLHRYAGVAFDTTRRRALWFGGGASNGVAQGDTWEWDNVQWYEWSPALSPAARAGTAMAYDSSRRVAVLFGGGTFGDTWEYSDPLPPAWADVFGASCPAPGLAPRLILNSGRLGSLPVLGRTFEVRTDGGGAAASLLVLGWSRTLWLAYGIPLPLDLTGAGMIGCSLQVDWSLLFTSSTRITVWRLPIPNSPDLLGLDGFFQGILFAPGINPLGLVTTNGLQFTLGG